MSYLPFREPKKITSPFGWRAFPIAGFHNGTDYGGVGYTTEVLALEDGYITHHKDSFGGLYVWHRVHNQKAWMYLHLSKFVGKPRYVKQGEVVGITGSSGLAFGPHLHLGLKINGRWVDPVPTVNFLNNLNMKYRDVELYEALVKSGIQNSQMNDNNVLQFWNKTNTMGVSYEQQFFYTLAKNNRSDVFQAISNAQISARDWFVENANKEYKDFWNGISDKN